MTARRGADFDLARAVADPGFTPRASDATALLHVLTDGGDLAKLAERALLRLGAPALPAVSRRAASLAGAERKTLVMLLGRLAAIEPGSREAGDARAFLLGELSGTHASSRSAAARALERSARAESAAPSVRAEIVQALASALEAEDAEPVRGALLLALGRIGGPDAASHVARARAAGHPDPRGDRAELIARRTEARRLPSKFRGDAEADRPTDVRITCRAGLEELLCEELADRLPDVRLRTRLTGIVDVVLEGAPARLTSLRTMLAFGFPLPSTTSTGSDLAAEIAARITSPAARAILERWTEGPIRWRLAWERGGKRRAVVWRVAELVHARAPQLMNDPTDSTWEAIVRERDTGLEMDLVPAFDDPRWPWRRADVPAASHPTLASALVRLAGVRADDVVWDPFVGSGLELCERALAGPHASLLGSDLEPRALAAARANLDAAGVRRARLERGDALEVRPPAAPTLVITNPPMGRRVHRGADLEQLLCRFVQRTAETLAPGGRLAWISPLPERTRAVARNSGLSLRRAIRVDMGGFEAEMQLFERRAEEPPRRAAAKDEERHAGRDDQGDERNDDRERDARPRRRLTRR